VDHLLLKHTNNQASCSYIYCLLP